MPGGMPSWHSPGEAQLGGTEMDGKAWPWKIQEQMAIRNTGKQLKFEKADPSHNVSGRSFLPNVEETLLDAVTPQLLEALLFLCWSPVVEVML